MDEVPEAHWTLTFEWLGIRSSLRVKSSENFNVTIRTIN